MDRYTLRWVIIFVFFLFIPCKLRASTYSEGEILILLKPDFRSASSIEKFRSIAKSYSLKITKLARLNTLIIKSTNTDLSVHDLKELFKNNPSIKAIEPNYKVHAAATIPNDQYFPLQWALFNYGQSVNGFQGTADADIDMPEAWDYSQCSDAIVVAVLDTGLDYTHPDIDANVWNNPDEKLDSVDNDNNGYVDDIYGWDFINDDNDPMDDNSHGTHVSGIIGAEGNNNAGISGICWKVKIMPLKVLDSQGSGTIGDVLSAIDYAIAKGVNIINASYVGPDYSQIEYNAIKAAADAGILFIAAAGNNQNGNGIDIDQDPRYPAAYNLDNIISVAASDQNDDIAYFSNYGQISVDVSAPGVNILSLHPNSSYIYLSGTSMAAPHVTALAALLWSINPKLSYSLIREIILNTVDIIDSQLSLTQTGGRINAYKATLLALSTLSGSTNGSGGGGGGGGGCFIATATYDTFLAPEVVTLRTFRDNYLKKNLFGRVFINLYYKYSPPIARIIRHNKFAKDIAIVIITPIVYIIKYPEAFFGISLLLLACYFSGSLILRSYKM